MTYIVDQLFPPMVKNDEDFDYMEYSSFNYWRDPISFIDVEVNATAAPSCSKQEKEEMENQSANALQLQIQSTSLPTIPEN